MNIINFSGGRTSAYMTKRLIDEGLTDYIVTFQNTGKEMPETLDFINECDKRWNHEESLQNKGGAFKKEITYKQLKERSQAQQGLFDGDPSFECFCNID